jgi:hypothetical protein
LDDGTQPVLDAFVPIMADGVKWIVASPRHHWLVNLGYFNDVLSEEEKWPERPAHGREPPALPSPDCELRREGSVLHVRHGRAAAAIETDVPFEVYGPETGRGVHRERLGIARPNAMLEMVGKSLPWAAAVWLRPG